VAKLAVPKVAVTKFPRYRRSKALGSALSVVGSFYHPQDATILVASVFVLLLASRSMTPAGVFYDMVTAPPSVALPGDGVGGGSSILLDRIRPADEYQTIPEDTTPSAQQFQKLAVEEYSLVEGDTLLGLALSHDLRMDTLVSFNQIDDVRRMRVGDTYRIPNRDGLLYTVREGDSLLSIANAHGTETNAILDANDMISSEISVGEVLFVPNARMNETDLKLILGELFVYPVRGRFTSGFGMRNDPFTGVRRFHNGIDLAGAPGTPIRAAMAGRVVHIETQIGNYGRFVIIRHDGGFQTLYGHLDGFSVRVGQYVSQGGLVGTMGNTGRSTGPHLHFSIIKNGSFVDPLEFLH
jgi:murein DD-endopeptidase MepM/ murein hydrolase activator NlpD